jgi:hypothetical protein
MTSELSMAHDCPSAHCVAMSAMLICILVSYATPSFAQPPQNTVAGAVSVASEWPDVPKPTWQQQTSNSEGETTPQIDSGDGKQTKRILGVIPNFRSVSVNSRLPAQTAKEKFAGFAEDSFDYSSFIFIGLLSGVSQLQGSTPEFHSGPPAFARYYWHSFADQTDENLWVGFLLPVALHQDARYYTLGSGTKEKHIGVVKRVGYAFSRILMTRTDSGGSNFNFSEVVGAGASSGISNLYYPSSNRTWTKTGQRWALNVGIDGGTFIFKEFWPDINHAIFHRN